MKIEKISDNQIRCTLSKEDLEDRNIKLTELAFGTGKTKELFQDMMRQANDDFGFEVDDIPLMVEAIPLSPESIILVITKVNDVEETEEHLQKFFPENLKEKFKQNFLPFFEEHEIDLEDFENIEGRPEHPEKSSKSSDSENDDSLLYSIYVFDSLRDIITVSELLVPFFQGDSSVYKSPFDNKFYLSLCMEASEEKQLNKICGILTEHGKRENPTYVKELFYMEHFDEIIPDKAIETLGQI